MIKGYILDLDGTILDSMKLWDNLATYYLASLNINAGADLKDILAPLTINEAIAYLKDTYHLDKDLNTINQEINTLLEQLYLTEVALKKGAKEFIQKLSANKKRLCLLTANNYDLTLALLNKFKLTTYFSQILTCDKLNLNKQDGNIYEYASNSIGLDKHECIVIEDAYHAIKAAKNSGFIVWTIRDDSNEVFWDKIVALSDQCFDRFNEMEVV